MSTEQTHDDSRLAEELAAGIEAIPLIDHHVHGTLRHEPDRRQFEGMLSESDRPVPDWMTQFDSQVGLAIRRWCAPLLGLAPLASADDYMERRQELGEAEVTRRLLHGSGVETVGDHEIPQVGRVLRHVIPHPRGHVIPHGDEG
ncbi:hypothetical protein ABT245_38745, partial [Streptomyces sp. NPDC001508]